MRFRREPNAHLIDIVLGISGDNSCSHQSLDKFLKRAADMQRVRRQIVQLLIFAVAGDEPLIFIEHAQALWHVFCRGLETLDHLLDGALRFVQPENPADVPGAVTIKISESSVATPR